MGRVIWKENKVLSIETRKGVFVLAQIIKSPHLVFFNCFREDNDFRDVELKKVPVLFLHAVTRQFLKKSTIETVDINPMIDYQPPKKWIKEDLYTRKVTIWEGTEHEKQFISFGENGATLIKRDIINPTAKNEESSSKIIDLENDCLDEIRRYELTTVEIYPNLNERLYLCYLKGENVDPAKDILFNIEMPIEYQKYVDIVSGSMLLKDLGY